MSPASVLHEPPKGLVSRILRRIGFERQLMSLRRHRNVIVAFLFGATAGVSVTVIAIRSFLEHSGFGPYLSLARTDFGFIVGHFRPFISAVTESAPSVLLSVGLFATALLLFCLRLAVFSAERIGKLKRTIDNS